jgi:hypothetical protein
MQDYLLLMHGDVQETCGDGDDAAWEAYFSRLIASGNFQGGSSIGTGLCIRKSGTIPVIAGHLTGYIRVIAENIDHARALVAGHPGFEAGGTVEIRELPKDG